MTQASRITNEIVFLYNGEISDSIHENIFSARIEKDEDKKYLVLRQGIRLSTRLPVSGSVRISIDSFGLSLYRREEIPEPGENQFKARLIQIAEYCGKIRAMVSVGLPVTLYMEQNEFNAADLKIGSELILEIPEDSVRII
jgi:tungstate transport system ATP-binding protein